MKYGLTYTADHYGYLPRVFHLAVYIPATRTNQQLLLPLFHRSRPWGFRPATVGSTTPITKMNAGLIVLYHLMAEHHLQPTFYKLARRKAVFTFGAGKLTYTKKKVELSGLHLHATLKIPSTSQHLAVTGCIINGGIA